MITFPPNGYRPRLPVSSRRQPRPSGDRLCLGNAPLTALPGAQRTSLLESIDQYLENLASYCEATGEGRCTEDAVLAAAARVRDVMARSAQVNGGGSAS